MLTVGSLFAGIGGFDLGFERAGHRCLWQVEIDRDARAVLAARFPEATRHEDVRDCGAHNLAPVDVITFGSPCQDLSVAGRRAGFDGERSGLFFEAVRIVRELRPRYAVWENVPGALSSNGGRDFGAALDALADAGAVDIAWRVLDAQWFGVAQRRRRVFLVADFGGERAASVLFEPESGGRDTPPRREAGQRVTGPIADSSGSRGWSSSVDVQMWVEVPSVEATLGSRGTRSHTELDGHGAYVPEVAYCLAAGAGNRFGSGRDGQDTFVPERVAHALTAEGHDASEDGGHAIAYHENIGGNVAGADHARAQRAGASKSYQFVGEAMAVRRLTPLECCRLQAFPDDWLDGLGLSDSAKYRLLGNAVCVNVAAWIGGRLALFPAPGRAG